MNPKQIIGLGFIVLTLGLCSNEFTLSRTSCSAKNVPVSAKKNREAILEQLGQILKNLLQHDKAVLEMRAIFQEEMENCLCSEDFSLIASSSKIKLQQCVDLLQEVNQQLQLQTEKIQELKIKIKKLKTGKLKG